MSNLAKVMGVKKPTKKIIVDLGDKGKFSLRPGLLHKHLGIPEGEKIPEERLQEALKSKNPDIQKEARSALGLRGMGKK